MKIKLLFSLFLVLLFGVVQAQLKLKKGQKFSYEAINSSDCSDQRPHWKEYQYWKINFEVISHRDGIYTLKASPEVLIALQGNKMLDSTLPDKEQPGDFMAIANKVLTQSSYKLQVDEAGNIQEVKGLPEIKKKTLAKLQELHISDGYQTHQELAETVISDHEVKKLSSFFSSFFQNQDPITGLILSATTDNKQSASALGGAPESIANNSLKFSLIRSKDKSVKEQLPLKAEAKAALQYEKYYSPINKVRQRIQEMIETFIRNKGSQTIEDKIMKQLDSLDKGFAKDDYEYLGAKLRILTFMNTSYWEALKTVPYTYLPTENDVLNKMNGELAQGNFSNVKQGVELCFAGFRGESIHPMDTTYTSSLIHDKFGGLIHRIKDRDSIQTALTIINQIEELQIPVLTGMLKGMKTYVQVKLATGQQELAIIANTYFNSPFDKAGRYRILIYDELYKKQIPDSVKRAYIEYTIDLNQKNMEALHAVTATNKASFASKDDIALKIVYKKNLADAYYRRSRLQKNTELAYLQLAADYLPTPQDISLNNFGLKIEYEFSPFVSYTAIYLAAAGNDKLTDEARFGKYVDMVILEPERYFTLKENYTKAFPQKDFKSFFSAALKSKLPSTPQFSLNERLGTLVTSKDQQGKFVFVDFWGTWCGACVSEIDKLRPFT